MRLPLLRLGLLLAPTLILAGCGGGGDDAEEIDPSILGTVAPSPTPPAAGTQAVAITATDFAFEPAAPELTAGAAVTVTFTNSGAVAHTLNFFSDSALRNRIGETGQIAAGGTATVFFLAPEGGQSVYFRCQLHPSRMSGEMVAR